MMSQELYFVAAFFALTVQCFDMSALPMPPIPDMPAMPDLSALSGSMPTAEIRQAIKTCRSQMANFSPEEAISIVTQNAPTSSNGECFLTCVKKEIGIIGDDDTYNMDRIREILGPLQTKNSALYDKIITACEECADAGAGVEDYCEKAKKLRMCVREKGLSGNLPL